MLCVKPTKKFYFKYSRPNGHYFLIRKEDDKVFSLIEKRNNIFYSGNIYYKDYFHDKKDGYSIIKGNNFYKSIRTHYKVGNKTVQAIVVKHLPDYYERTY